MSDGEDADTEPTQDAMIDGKETLLGEVIAVEVDGIRVRLDNGEIGLLALATGECPAEGARGAFCVEHRTEQGTIHLSLLSVTAASDFDREFDRLTDVLASRRSAPSGRRDAFEDPRRLYEQNIEAWVARVDKAVGHLRKHRSKRLNEQLADGS